MNDENVSATASTVIVQGLETMERMQHEIGKPSNGLDDLRMQIQNAAISFIPVKENKYKKRRRSFESAKMFDSKRTSKSSNFADPIKLNASNRGLTSFEPIYEMIMESAHCHIGEIDLSNNVLTHLLDDESAKPLKSVSGLNLLDNLKFESVKKTATEIQQIFPNLRSLQFSLSEEEDVSFIIRTMPALEFLNGIKVNRTELGEMAETEKLEHSLRVDEVPDMAKQVDNSLQEMSVNRSDMGAGSRKNRAARRKSVGSTSGAMKRRKSNGLTASVHEQTSVDIKSNQEFQRPLSVAASDAHHQAQSVVNGPMPDLESPVEVTAPTPVAPLMHEVDVHPQLSAIKEEDPLDVPASEGRCGASNNKLLGIGAGLRATANNSQAVPPSDTKPTTSVVDTTNKKTTRHPPSRVASGVDNTPEDAGLRYGVVAAAEKFSPEHIPRMPNLPRSPNDDDDVFFGTDGTKADLEREPELRPQDLEELATIFDRIRILYKKRGEGDAKKTPKLISKSKVSNGDDLATQFDERLSKVMQRLSKVFNDSLMTGSQRHIEIDRAKYGLYEFCQSVCTKFLTHWRQGINSRDAAELQSIQTTIARNMQTSFARVWKFSQNNHLDELRHAASAEVNRMSRKCTEYEALKADFAEVMADRKDREQEVIRQQAKIAEITRENERLHADAARNRDALAELADLRAEAAQLRAFPAQYENLRKETSDLRAEVLDRTQHGNEVDLENIALGKQLRAKQLEVQRQTRLVSHLKEELQQLRDESEYLVQENQTYLDRIIRQSKDPRSALTPQAEQEIAEILRRALDTKKSRLTHKLQLPEDGPPSFDRGAKQRKTSSRHSDKRSKAPSSLNNRSHSGELDFGKTRKANRFGAYGAEKDPTRLDTSMNRSKGEKLNMSRSDTSQRSKARSVTRSKRSKEGRISGRGPISSLPGQTKTNGYTMIHSQKRAYNRYSPQKSISPVPASATMQTHRSQVSFSRTRTLQPEQLRLSTKQDSRDVLVDAVCLELHKPPLPPAMPQTLADSIAAEAEARERRKSTSQDRSVTKEEDGERSKISKHKSKASETSPFDSTLCKEPEDQADQKKDGRRSLGAAASSKTGNNQTSKKKARQNSKKKAHVFLGTTPKIEDMESHRTADKEKKVGSGLKEESKDQTSATVEHGMPTDINLAFSFNDNPRRPMSPPEKRDTDLLGNLDSRSRSVPAGQMTMMLSNILHFTERPFESSAERQTGTLSSNQISDIIKRKLATPAENSGPQTKRSQAHMSHRKRQSVLVMSLKQLRELIVDIFAQKKKHDQRCVKVNRQSRETMQQFLQTYLSQKYGLRSLVIEQASAIIAACQQYQEECCEVMAFGKVLRNQVDEEFRDQQVAMKASLSNHMRQVLRERYTTKTQGDLNRMLTDLESGRTMVDHWLWTQTLNLIFDATDIFILQDRLRNVAQYRQLERAQMKTKAFQFATDTRANERRRSREMAPRNAAQKGQKKRGRPTSVQQTQTHQTMRFSYQDLLATLLSFQLQEREAYLKHFLLLFQSVDTDGDGVVSNSQFTELYRRMRQRSIDEAQCFDVAVEWRADCDRLLDLVDPYGQDRITFSDVVHLFGNTRRENHATSKHQTGNAKDSLTGVAGLESTDSQFRSFLHAVPPDSSAANAVNEPSRIHPGFFPKQHVQPSQQLQYPITTFAPNTGIGSKSSLAAVSEESGNQTTQSPMKHQVQRLEQASKNTEQGLLEALQKESDIAQRDMMKKLKLDVQQVPCSAQLAAHQIVDPGSSHGVPPSANQSQRLADSKISPLKAKNSALIAPSRYLKDAAGTQVTESATELNSELPNTALCAQEQKLAAEINQIDEKLKKRI